MDKKEKKSIYDKKRYKLIKHILAEKYWKNREDRLSYKKEWYKANRKKLLAKAKLYQIKNRAKVNAVNSKRKAKKLQATPFWLTKKDFSEIQGFYVAASELAALAKCKLHVDHIVPLNGTDVCGLHVPWNLQLLTEEENIRKGNRYEDDK